MKCSFVWSTCQGHKRGYSWFKTAARVVCGVRKHDHISPALADLPWLKVEERVDYKILLLTYKALNGKAPRYIHDLISLYSTTKRLRSIHDSTRLQEGLLRLPTYGGRAFSFYAPKIWNTIPAHIRVSESIYVFKKTFLYKRSFKDL